MAGDGGSIVKRICMSVTGYGFLVLGVLGLFLPILQGVLFLVVGLLILSQHAPWAARVLAWIKGRHPKIHDTITKAEEIAERWIERASGGVRRLFGR